jgi:hypothetical protein
MSFLFQVLNVFSCTESVISVFQIYCGSVHIALIRVFMVSQNCKVSQRFTVWKQILYFYCSDSIHFMLFIDIFCLQILMSRSKVKLGFGMRIFGKGRR